MQFRERRVHANLSPFLSLGYCMHWVPWYVQYYYAVASRVPASYENFVFSPLEIL